jgi:hypothetical protein
MIINSAIRHTIVSQHVVRLTAQFTELRVKALQACLWAAVDPHKELYESYLRGKYYF